MVLFWLKSALKIQNIGIIFLPIGFFLFHRSIYRLEIIFHVGLK